MRRAVAALLAGETLLLTGLAMWHVEVALVVAGAQLIAPALLREFDREAGK